jgi:membrane fusion protein, multidrug efflux system
MPAEGSTDLPRLTAAESKPGGPETRVDGWSALEQSPHLRDPREDSVRTRAPMPPGERRKEEVPRVDQSRRRFPWRAFVFAFVLSIVVAVAGFLYWDYDRRFETTDDAFIAARQFAIAPKVSGYLNAVPVTDNQHVPVGGVVARIDDRDYRTALAQADAQLAAAQSNIESIDAQIAVQQAQVTEGQAQIEQAEANLVFAQQQAARFAILARTGAGSVQHAQQYDSQLHQQQAALKSAQAALVSAERQVTALKAQRSTAEAQVAQATARRHQAELNLSYTIVTAAEPGRVVNLSAAVGEYVSAGTNLTMFVPDDIWVTANFKETQLDKMRPGDKVTLRVDAYPERLIHGHVASVQPGSGTAFSLLPAENATGNYVKIVQRVPVKIIIDNPPTDVALGPGMSVDPTVRVDPQPSFYERLRGWL